MYPNTTTRLPTSSSTAETWLESMSRTDAMLDSRNISSP
ncbi:hypothetical protein SAVIM40S_00739 [Streptomyces avidinii]